MLAEPPPADRVLRARDDARARRQAGVRALQRDHARGGRAADRGRPPDAAVQPRASSSNTPGQGAARGTWQNLADMVRGASPEGANCNVIAIGRAQLPLTTMGLAMGSQCARRAGGQHPLQPRRARHGTTRSSSSAPCGSHGSCSSSPPRRSRPGSVWAPAAARQEQCRSGSSGRRRRSSRPLRAWRRRARHPADDDRC